MDKTKHAAAKRKKLRRKEDLAERNAVDDVIREAYRTADHLLDCPDFIRFECNGLSVNLESTSGTMLSKAMQQIFQGMLKVNMEGAYDVEWPKEEKVKRREMVEEDALYIVARLNETEHVTADITGSPVVAFLHYRFVMEEDFPVLYVYELQLEKSIQGKGLGKFLMQLMELIARKNKMKCVMLTVQRRNTRAMDFYKSKLRYATLSLKTFCYKVSSHSPTRVDPVVWADCSYEILCKTLDAEAKLKFEVVYDRQLP